jgi:cobyrinic acid a,c-diamide synthase
VSAPGLILAAPASGSGKTVTTLGLVRALARRGVKAAAAKAGPDYIDAGFHAAASGRPCFNLDPWAMRPETIAALIAEIGSGAELVLCEGVMGLFDGGPAASTADLAALTGWPVVLVVDVRGQGASAAALVQGFARHRADVFVAGAIFNRVASPAHRKTIESAMVRTDVPVLGYLPRDPDLALPERHLGLVQAGEIAGLESFLDHAAERVETNVDIARLASLARPAAVAFRGNTRAVPIPPLGQRIAVARDDAFAFCYEAVLAGWRAQGVAVIPFSPLAGEVADESCDAIYLPGGYPELHGEELARSPALEGLRRAAKQGAVIYGECGGYMVLGNGIEDASGARHQMAGLLPLETSFAKRRLHLGYREAEAAGDSALGGKGARFRGHEFHYASIASEGPGHALFRCRDLEGCDTGAAGLIAGRVMGSFIHLVDQA